MGRIKYLLAPVLLLLLLSSFRPVSKYIRKAARSTEKGNIREAKIWYSKALEVDKDNYRANLGLGLILCDLNDNYAAALPHLENAYAHSPKDTLGDLLYALAKCYHNVGNYEKAISIFERLEGYVDYEGEINLDKDVKKRKQDCLYALARRNEELSKDVYIVNAGRTINSEMAEYVPVITPENELIFTSRRKDDEKEQVSYLDGKYFESMYICKINPNGFATPRRYTLPDQVKSDFRKHHESVVSMSANGKKLFTFRDNKIYEINIDERKTEKPRKLQKSVNFDFYQSHAFLTKDGNALYFTSEAKGGLGGLDIYRSVKIKDGEWSKPENLGEPVNTSFDEDAPFLSDDGKTLFFASTGHEGYGNYDIYRSELVDGKWTRPVNLGKPFNSSANDIFYVEDADGRAGYFSSSRPGGYGDMDIYKIVYLNKIDRSCPEENRANLKLSVIDSDTNDYRNRVEVIIPENYKVLAYEWTVNGTPAGANSPVLDHDYAAKGVYRVESKIVAYCDTCLNAIVACNALQNRFGSDVPVVAASEPADLSKIKGRLNEAQLRSIGFDVSPILFDFNSAELRPDAEKILLTNNGVLKKYKSLYVEIIGYTDTRGSLAYNKALSARRANSVKKYLAKAGIRNDQIKTSLGKGMTEPAVKCDADCDENAHQQNRRVIFVVYNK